MEISQEPIVEYTMYIRFSREELEELAKDADYIGKNLNTSAPMDQLLTALEERWQEVNVRTN